MDATLRTKSVNEHSKAHVDVHCFIVFYKLPLVEKMCFQTILLKQCKCLWQCLSSAQASIYEPVFATPPVLRLPISFQALFAKTTGYIGAPIVPATLLNHVEFTQNTMLAIGKRD